MSERVDPFETLSPERQALLQAILRQKAARAAEPEAIRLREGGGPAPLSFAQERLWFLHRLRPDSVAYNMPSALRLDGVLDVPALERALGEVVRRHESLRTTFAEAGGSAVQVVAPFAGFTLPVEDLSALPEGEREASVRRRRAEVAGQPFDLAAGPLFRAVLLRTGRDEHVLVVCMHHIVGDGWSTGLLFRELAALYAACRDGGESPLPELPVQYADFAAWQREQLQGPALERQLAWWMERLAGAPALLELPADHPRPAAQTYGGARVPVELPASLVERLQALARREGATLYMLLLGAFQVLLSKYAGTDDVVVGSPVAGRTRREVEELIGFFANTLVLRTDLSGDPGFRQLLGRVREVTLGAYEHQEVPFEKLVAGLHPERSLSHSPVFQVLFSLQNDEPSAGGLAGLRVQGLPDEMETARFDLSLSLAEDAGGVRGVLTYSTDLFERGTAERMVRHLARVLEQVAADPDVRLSWVDLLDAGERERVLAEWNRTAAAYPADRGIHQLFEAQAARTPDDMALVHAGERLAYRELDERANRLAHRLAALGVGPEDRVALCLEAGAAGITGLLGILKAGAAYLPLDLAAPDERIAFILDEAGVRVMVGETATASRPWAAGRELVRIDRPEELSALPATPPAARAGAGNLAYVLYTSGSTGRPKGVLVEHGSVCNVATAFARIYGLGAGDRMLLLTPLHFDPSVADAFATLCSGAALHVPHGAAALPGDEQVQLLERERITHAKFTPSALAALPFAALPDLKVLAVGGEACPAGLAARWRPGRRFLNTYGPTEATVRTAVHECGDEPGAPPLGRPVPNGQLYVLDAALNPLPAGVPGELVAGGVPVARGYLGRPALTAERFVPDPFGGRPGARLYRTGDRARWTERTDALTHSRTHALEFLGRLDEQVKIRGFRIEPGEIQAVLRLHPGVAECAVVAREDVPGKKRLAAYVVGTAQPDELRAHLRRSLPEYMVPAAFVSLDRLPLTSNGKLDRRALPAPEYAAAAERYVAPRTPAETALARIWAELLRLDRVGVQDNFFELGGDSILCIQVVARARREGVGITPRQMFEHQTIAGLAAAASGEARLAPAAEQGRVAGPVALTPIQRRHFEAELAAPWHHNQSVLLDVDAEVDDAALEAALSAVLEHHDALRLRFRRTDAGWEQWHADEVGIALERIGLSHLDPDEQDRAQAEAADRRQAGLDLERGPLGAAVLFDRGARGRVLFLALHHLVVDAVSWRILREDLERACAQLQAGQAAGLGAKSTSYRQWAETLEAYASSDALRAEAAHWLAQGADGVAPLPVEDTGGGTIGGTRTVSARLEAEETRALLQEVPAAYRTQINDVLLCALADAVGEWTGGSRVRLALEGHGREEEVGAGVDLTRTVGWFTSVYPVVLDTAGAAGPGERLKRVKEQLRAVPKRGIGYGVLRYLGPDVEVRGALAAQPEPEISFNYLGQFGEDDAAAGRFRFAAGPRGRDSADENRQRYLLDVNGAVRGGRLQLDWSYPDGALRPEAVERVAAACLRALRELVAHCRQAGPGGCTPSDFPLAELAQEELDAVVAGKRVEDLYPLSPLQEGLLFHALEDGGTQAYQITVGYRLEGRLDPERFRRAWAEAVARHAVLRTSFVWQGVRRPLQRVEAAVEVPWTVEDWRDRSAEEQEAALDDYLARDRARGFRLDQAPLLRCALFRVADDAQWVVWNNHHLLLDGWASSRVVNEIFRLYDTWSAGREVEPKRVRPYREYIAWLRRQDPAATEAYWRAVLAGFTAPTPLGVDRPAGAAPARYAKRVAALTEEWTRRLGEAARQRQVTLHTVVQGGWALILSRYAGEEDVVFGNTVSGRPAQLEGVEEMVGLFINTLPARVRVRGGARLGDWLAELQRAQAEAREYEYASLAQVQGWSEVPRGTPLFESHFVFENFPAEEGASAGPGPQLRVTGGRVVEWTNYPLSLMAGPGDRLVLRLSYDESRFDADTVSRMLAHLVRVLEQAAQDMDRPLRALTLLGGAERARVVEEWNRTDDASPSGRPVHHLFEEQARRTPDAPAVVCGERSLTYRELDGRASRLAHHLRRLGVGPESRVGLFLERGPELVVSLLAVLKAGGAYVPVDAANPPKRIAYVLADAGVTVLVTREALRQALPPLHGVAVLDVGTEWEGIAAGTADAPESGVAGENLAYVLYTSGSTGLPKGVAVEHRQLGAYLAWASRAYPGRSSAVHSPLAFDLTVTSLFVPLLAGGSVELVEEEAAVEGLAKRLEEGGQYGMLKLTPAHLRVLAERLDGRAAGGGAECLVVGGEPLLGEQLEPWKGRLPETVIVNEYGPTETVVGCCTHAQRLRETVAGPVPIGRPVPGTRLYVVDEAMNPLPAGVPGELYVGGAQVTRGYLGRPALTAERFVPDPFSAEPGARLYRTGDRARWKESASVRECVSASAGDSQEAGHAQRSQPPFTHALTHPRTHALEYLGRLDEQVKLRGFRIEPAEVEGALLAHDGVREARVVVREDEPGEKRLVAYVVGPAQADELREHLAGSVPEYMVPAAFVTLESLPLTPNGKLDRAALPAPEQAPAGTRYVAPRTPVEEALAEIWAEVLKLERVGVDDNFFQLGGHSILGIRVALLIREIFGVRLSPRTVFDTPTIAGLATLLTTDPRYAEAVERVAALMQRAGAASPAADA